MSHLLPRLSSLRAVFVACALLVTGAQIGAQTAEEIFATANEKFFAGDFKAALEDYNRVLELEPRSDNALAQRALTRLHLEDVSGARADVAAALSLNGESPRALYARATIRGHGSDFSGALADIEAALDLAPEDGQFLELQARLFQVMGNFDDAALTLNHLIELYPDIPDVHAERARVHRRRGDLTAALADFDQVLEIDPAHAGIHGERGWMKFYQLDWSGAIDDGRHALQETPQNADAARLVGYAHFGVGRYEESVTSLEKAATSAPGAVSAYALFFRHFAALRLGRTDDVLAQAATTWKDDAWKAMLTRFILGDATEDEVEALAESPTDEVEQSGRECEAHFYIGLVRLQTGDRTTARLRFRAAVATGRTTFVEHVLARAELDRL